TEHLTVVGQTADSDALVFEQPAGAGADTFEYTPGIAADAGTVSGVRAGALDFTPATFTGFSLFVDINSDDTSDTVIVNGTAADDVVSVADSTSFPGFQAVIVNGHTPLIPTDPALVLRGLGGNDTFNIDFNPLSATATASAIRVEGGDSDGSS